MPLQLSPEIEIWSISVQRSGLHHGGSVMELDVCFENPGHGLGSVVSKHGLIT